ncbi:WD40 repeat domain-containing protein [Methanoregula sp.]|uniref:WD40 repeat domain-containing protein n=1 Tax=Methanoregula sp. TaxID=2052170 RepID=UPI0023724ACE|nr:WD40 repeat domain-containing protein [Methanoregula sp.]MDD1686627.1 hypothetical protein [Methanoregula sp.]
MRNAFILPLIGSLLLRRDVWRLAGAVKSGDITAVCDLAAIAATSPDTVARAIAREGLSAIPSQEAVDALCREVLMREDPALRELAMKQGYAPSEPGARAIFLYLTGQDDALFKLDPEPHHPILAQGYAEAPGRIQAMALRSARDHGRALAHALLETDPNHAARAWSYDEWEVVLETLAGEKSWDTLWMLIGQAPPALSVSALHRMNNAGWYPGGDARQVFEEMIRNLPKIWTAPVPERPLVTREIQEKRSLRISFSRDGSLLASGTCDGQVTVWQVASSRLVASCSTGTGSVRFLALTPDNTILITGGDRGTLHATSISNSETIWTWDDPCHPITTAILSANGDEILAGDTNGVCLRIGCATGTVHHIDPGCTSPVTAIATTPDGLSIATGHADGAVCSRDTLTGAVKWMVPGTGDPVRALAFPTPTETDTRCLIVIRGQTPPVLLSAENGEPVRIYTGYTGHISCHAISPDGRSIGIGGDDNVLLIWQDREYPAAEIPLYNRSATCCAFVPEGTYLATCCNDGTIYYLNVPDGGKVKEFRAYRRPVTTCAISPDGRFLATTGWDGMIALRSIPSGELLRTLKRPTGAVTALALVGDGGILAGTADGTAWIFPHGDASAGRSIDMYTPSIRALAASPDGAFLACAGKEPNLRIWDMMTGSLVASCEGLKTTVRCLAFLPNGKTCISGGWDGVVRLWDVPSGTAVGTRTGHTSIINCCAVDPSGVLFVTGSNDTTVRIWNHASGKEPVILRDAAKEVNCCTISPDSMLLAAAGLEPVIWLYSLPEGMLIGTIPSVPGKLTALSFTTDGLALAAGYASGTLAFYSIHDRSLIRTLYAHAGTVTGIVPVSGKDYIVTSGEDGRIHTFGVPYQHSLSLATLDDLMRAQEQEKTCGNSGMAEQWRFLCELLALRFQNEIELCPVFRDAGVYDIQIVG